LAPSPPDPLRRLGPAALDNRKTGATFLAYARRSEPLAPPEAATPSSPLSVRQPTGRHLTAQIVPSSLRLFGGRHSRSALSRPSLTDIPNDLTTRRPPMPAPAGNQNARRHGLSSLQALPIDPQEYATLHAAWTARYRPTTPEARDAVHRLTVSLLRLRVLDRVEAHLFSFLDEDCTLPLPAPLPRHRDAALSSAVPVLDLASAAGPVTTLDFYLRLRARALSEWRKAERELVAAAPPPLATVPEEAASPAPGAKIAQTTPPSPAVLLEDSLACPPPLAGSASPTPSPISGHLHRSTQSIDSPRIAQTTAAAPSATGRDGRVSACRPARPPP
jgi:hypothetical protein